MQTGQADFPGAVARWREALGDDHVRSADAVPDVYARNVSGLTRRIEAVLKPGSVEEVEHIVRIANEYGAALYPFSTGKNWGLGSFLPVRDGAAIVDLSRMNRIREVNELHHYAVIEPGVTQRQLYEHIRDNRLSVIMNVTGSGADTSLIGNSLERGVGYFASRADALTGLEVVLGNGQRIRTGFGHDAGSAITHLYKPGIGPELGGLFAQSNFGIVTAAGFALMPRPEAHVAVVAKIADDARFAEFFDALADLRRCDVIRTAFHMGNRNRSEISLAPLVYDHLVRREGGQPEDVRKRVLQWIAHEGFGPWNAVGGVMGTRGQVREAVRQMRARLKGIASVTVLSDRKIENMGRLLDRLSFLPGVRRKKAMLAAIRPLYGLARGVPTDVPLKSVYWPVGEVPPDGDIDPDQGYSGMLYCLPFFPMTGADARRAVEKAETVFGRFGFKAHITLNLVDTRCAEAVINLAFDRRHAEQTEKAHEAVEQLTRAYVDMGYSPYRVGIQSMHLVVNEDDPFWQTVRDLKKVLDPNGIIAPGRYNLV